MIILDTNVISEAMKEILTKLKNPPAERTLRDDLAALRKAGIIGSKAMHAPLLGFLRMNELVCGGLRRFIVDYK